MNCHKKCENYKLITVSGGEEQFKMKRINIWDLWEREWANAYRFFNSKGNVDTKSRHKDRWYNDFKKMLIELETTFTENFDKK